MSVKLKFPERSIIWLYIPLIKDIKEKEEHTGLRPFLLSSTTQGTYEFATMTEHYKKPDFQYPIQHESSKLYQGKPINLNVKLYLEEKTLQTIMGNFFAYVRPYLLNEQDFTEFKQRQKKYFANPTLRGSRYEIKVI